MAPLCAMLAVSISVNAPPTFAPVTVIAAESVALAAPPVERFSVAKELPDAFRTMSPPFAVAERLPAVIAPL